MISSLWPQMLSVPTNILWYSYLPFPGQIVPTILPLPCEAVTTDSHTNAGDREAEAEKSSKASRRRTWTVEEDEKLLQIMKSMDCESQKRIPYHKIAKQFKGRTSKQIRERYLNHLNSQINKTPYHKTEDEFVLKYYSENGPKWKKLSLLLKGRTPTSLKNRFNTKLKPLLSCNSNSSSLRESSNSLLSQSSPLAEVREIYNSQATA